MRLKARRRVVVPAKAPEAAPAPPTLDLEEAWTEASALYANRKGMRVRSNWAFGVSERLFADRFAKLVGRPAAKRVQHMLRLLSDADLRVFHARATVSQEQAVAGARTTLILNVSAPVGFIVLLTSLLPPSVEDTLFADAFFATLTVSIFASVGLIVLLVIWYAFAGVQQARDLTHLATLEMARRGLAPTLGATDQNALEAKL